jgi:small subunit ribosomal protein S13
MEQKQPNDNVKHLVRIADTDLNGHKKIVDALKKIKGVSFMFANALCSITGIDKNAKTGLLTDVQVSALNTAIKNTSGKIPVWMKNRRKDYDTGAHIHVLTADLDYSRENDLKRLKMIKAYRGVRHMLGLPVRGQRTKSNFRKNKGKVRLGVIRKKETAQAAGAKDAKKDAKPAKGKDKK